MPLVSNSPSYQIVVYSRHATTFAVSTPLAWIESAHNLGWSDYLNDVPEAFFTLSQDDPAVSLIRSYLGRAHIRINRIDPESGVSSLVWGGWLGTEVDQTASDVIFYAHGYMSSLWYLHTDWDQSWTTSNLGTIAAALWTRAKTTIANSELNWCVQGTVQAPATTSGGATPIILPVYQTYYKRILFALRDLADIGRSDTTNAVVFEITPSGTFNFWGAKGADRDVAYTYGTRQIKDFRIIQTPIDRRNQVLAVGNSPRDLILRTEQSATPGVWGRRQEALLLQWVRDQTELERVAKLRMTKANRDYLQMMLMFHPGSVIPINVTGAPFELADRITIRITKGTVAINQRMLVSGIQVLFVGGVEHTRLLVEDI